MPTNLDLMRLQAATLYLLDERGRMLATNDVGQPPAPRVFLGRTDEGNVWHLRADLPPDLAARLTALLAAEPIAADLHLAPAPDRPAEPRCLPALRAALAESGPLAPPWRGPAYLVPSVAAGSSPAVRPGAGALARPDEPCAPSLVPPSVSIRELTADNLPLLPPPFDWLPAELAARAPCLAAVEAGRAVALCFCSRVGARAAEAGVETAPEARRRGLASAVAAAWAVAVRAGGRRPLYSTSWENLASRGVAARLGARLYGEDLSLR